GGTVAVRRGDGDVRTGTAGEPVRRTDGERLRAAVGVHDLSGTAGRAVGGGHQEAEGTTGAGEVEALAARDGVARLAGRRGRPGERQPAGGDGPAGRAAGSR